MQSCSSAILVQSKSAHAETTLQSMLPSQVSRKGGGRERFRGQQPLSSDFPCFATTETLFQEAYLKEFSLSSPQRGERSEEHPSVTANNTMLGFACQQHLSTTRATLPAQVFLQHSSEERKHFPAHKAIPLPHSQEMPGSGSSCSGISSQLLVSTLLAGGAIPNRFAKDHNIML